MKNKNWIIGVVLLVAIIGLLLYFFLTKNNNTSQQSEYTPSRTSANTTIENNNTTSSNEETVIRGNSKSKIYHCPGQKDYENMADSKYLVNFNSEQEAIDAGYRKASR